MQSWGPLFMSESYEIFSESDDMGGKKGEDSDSDEEKEKDDAFFDTESDDDSMKNGKNCLLIQILLNSSIHFKSNTGYNLHRYKKASYSVESDTGEESKSESSKESENKQ